jgi:hypothetical protein
MNSFIWKSALGGLAFALAATTMPAHAGEKPALPPELTEALERGLELPATMPTLPEEPQTPALPDQASERARQAIADRFQNKPSQVGLELAQERAASQAEEGLKRALAGAENAAGRGAPDAAARARAAESRGQRPPIPVNAPVPNVPPGGDAAPLPAVPPAVPALPEVPVAPSVPPAAGR